MLFTRNGQTVILTVSFFLLFIYKFPNLHTYKLYFCADTLSRVSRVSLAGHSRVFILRSPFVHRSFLATRARLLHRS